MVVSQVGLAPAASATFLTRPDSMAVFKRLPCERQRPEAGVAIMVAQPFVSPSLVTPTASIFICFIFVANHARSLITV